MVNFTTVILSLDTEVPAIGKRIVTTDADGMLIFWDPRSPSPIFKLTPDDGRFSLDGITAIAVNPSSSVVVVGGASGGVRVISLHKGDIIGAMSGHKEGESIEAIAFVGFAGGAETVVTAGTDGKACVWDLNTMRLRATLEHEVRTCDLSLTTIADACDLGSNYNPHSIPRTKNASARFRVRR